MTSSVPESSSSKTTASLAQVIAQLDALYPPRLAEEWDRVGLSVGDVSAPVRKIYFALDATTETITEALDWGADLIFTHHPFLFSPLDAVSTTTDRGHNVHRLIRGHCAVFSAHTNGDAARGGVNDVLALALGVRGTAPIVPSIADDTLGLGRVGDLPAPVTLREFAENVAGALPETAQGVRVAGDPMKLISRVAVLGGSGGSMLNEAVATGADVYVTSDLKHHDLLDFLEAQRNAHVIAGASPHEAEARTMAVVDVAHFASESPWLATAARTIQAVLAGAGFKVEVMVSDLSSDPWTFAP